MEPQDVGLVVESAIALLLTRTALRLVSMQSILDAISSIWAAAGVGDRAVPTSPSPETFEKAAWAVGAASSRLGGACLARSIALLLLLARRGVAGELCIAFRDRGDPLPGHAWIEVEGTALGADGRAVARDCGSALVVVGRFRPTSY